MASACFNGPMTTRHDLPRRVTSTPTGFVVIQAFTLSLKVDSNEN
jgi:hypothetical protein